MWKSGKYLFNPEFRAERVVNVCKHVDIHFCKSFWCLAENELMHILPSLVIPSLAVNRILSVPPEKLTFVNDDQADIDIPIPSSHIGTYHREQQSLYICDLKNVMGLLNSKLGQLTFNIY